MNYTKEQCGEARRRFLDGQPWEKIVEVFATESGADLTSAERTEILQSVRWKRPGVVDVADCWDDINAVLAKRGLVIAAKPAEGVVSMADVEKALGPVSVGNAEWLAHVPCTRGGMNVASAYEITELLRDRLSLLYKSNPEPTVTLVDTAEGRTLEVPASAVHEMEYPEAVTYTTETFSQERKSVCNICGACVSYKDLHTAWHEGKA